MRRKIIEWIFKREDFDWLMTQNQRAEFLGWFVRNYFPQLHIARNRPKKPKVSVFFPRATEVRGEESG